MLDYFLELFSLAQFVPHAVCLLWRPDLLVMHGLSDFLICAAYFAIPVTIMRAVRARPDLLRFFIKRMNMEGSGRLEEGLDRRDFLHRERQQEIMLGGCGCGASDNVVAVTRATAEVVVGTLWRL